MASLALPIIGGVTDLLGGLFGSNASKKAGDLLSGAIGTNANQLINANRNVYYNQELPRLNPYMQGGSKSFKTLVGQLSTPGQGLLQPYGSFQAPTLQQAMQEPGLQFQMGLGEQALQNSAAARGNLFSGDTSAALEQFGQGLGESSYNNVYNRALQNYLTNQGNFYTGQANTFNRLSGTAGMGLNASQLANQASQNYTGMYGNALNMANTAAEAQAAGIMGSGNAWQNALGGIGNNLMFGSMLNQLGGGGGNPTSGMPMSIGGASPMPGGIMPGQVYNPLPAQLTQSGYGSQ